jgi:leader peptidase (prepilin peptidase)/N-methyltransferase
VIPPVLAGVLGAIVAWRLPSTWDLIAYLYLAGLTIPLALTDFNSRRLPNRLILPAYPVLGVALSAAAITDGRAPDLARAMGGGAVLLVGYGILHAGRPDGLGAGDVKLAGILGLVLGWISWDAVLTGALTGLAIGGAIGMSLLVRGARSQAFALGPAMLAGAWLTILVATP